MNGCIAQVVELESLNINSALTCEGLQCISCWWCLQKSILALHTSYGESGSADALWLVALNCSDPATTTCLPWKARVGHWCPGSSGTNASPVPIMLE